MLKQRKAEVCTSCGQEMPVVLEEGNRVTILKTNEVAYIWHQSAFEPGKYRVMIPHGRYSTFEYIDRMGLQPE